ncbi:MAG: hypothetical protein CL681_00550 [Blastopirellula sp.]|nr:hypothetical protein [Blastopirellula sp.]
MSRWIRSQWLSFEFAEAWPIQVFSYYMPCFLKLAIDRFPALESCLSIFLLFELELSKRAMKKRLKLGGSLNQLNAMLFRNG